MKVQGIVIINKSGGLIHFKKFSNEAAHGATDSIDINEMLVFAGTFHGTYAIASQLTPRAVQQESQAAKTASSHETLSSLLPTINNTPEMRTSTLSSPAELAKVLQGGSYKAPDFFNPRVTNNTNKSGIKSISTDQFDIFCLQTVTGVKFLVFTSPGAVPTPDVADSILRRIYCLYSDYVMKNPFYSMEMPIKNQQFDKKLSILANAV